MRLDISARRGGKTTRAVEWVKAGRKAKKRNLWPHINEKEEADSRKLLNNRLLVVMSLGEKWRLVHEYGLHPSEVESFDVLIQRSGHSSSLRGKELFLDNAELILRGIIRAPIHGLSMTIGDIHGDQV